MALPRTPLFALWSSILLGILLLHLAGLLQPIESGLRWSLFPIARVFAAAGSGISRLRPSPEGSVLEGRARELEARLTAISVDYVKLRTLEEENNSLRKLAGFLGSSGYDHVAARVIARSSDPRTATVLIDRGTADGLENGMAVVMDGGVFVGKITALREHLSTVTLVADERSRIAASVAGSKELAGLVQGEGRGVARLSLIPQTQALKENDSIVTSGLEDSVPPNLPVALVNHVEGKPTDSFKSASLQPLVRGDRVNLVVVLLPVVLRPK